MVNPILFSTFALEIRNNKFNNEKEMVEWAKDNSGDFFSYQEVSDNLSKDAEVVDL